MVRIALSLVSFTVFLLCAFSQQTGACTSPSPPLQLVAKGSRFHVLLDSIQVSVAPAHGELSITGNGLTYHRTDSSASEDNFAFTALTSNSEEVSFTATIDQSGTRLHYHYVKSKPKDGNSGSGGTGPNQDGDYLYQGEVVVDGTVVSGPGTTIDIPDGAVVIGSDNSVDNDLAIIENFDGSEMHTHDNVGSLQQLAEILSSYPDGSITTLVLVGHGANGGVATLNGQNIDAESLLHPDNSAILQLLIDKLADNAQLIVLGCTQADFEDALWLQELANALGISIIANSGDVMFSNPWSWVDYFYGQGVWVQFDPSPPGLVCE